MARGCGCCLCLWRPLSSVCVFTAGYGGTASDSAKSKISFHSQLRSNDGVSSGHTLVLPNVYNNDGHAYDNTTGRFTAPHDGTYFFIASAGDADGGDNDYVCD